MLFNFQSVSRLFYLKSKSDNQGKEIDSLYETHNVSKLNLCRTSYFNIQCLGGLNPQKSYIPPNFLSPNLPTGEITTGRQDMVKVFKEVMKHRLITQLFLEHKYPNITHKWNHRTKDYICNKNNLFFETDKLGN